MKVKIEEAKVKINVQDLVYAYRILYFSFMIQEATLHVKVDRDTDEQLKRLAYARKISKGQLVREAIYACYQPSLETLTLPQRQALAAYQGGFISIGKLAEVMGMHVLQLRTWLDEHRIETPAVLSAGDTANA